MTKQRQLARQKEGKDDEIHFRQKGKIKNNEMHRNNQQTIRPNPVERNLEKHHEVGKGRERNCRQRSESPLREGVMR